MPRDKIGKTNSIKKKASKTKQTIIKRKGIKFNININ
jgi:hypothetical protein